MRIVAVRADVPWFGSTLTRSVVLPAPRSVETFTHNAVDVASHGHSLPARTDTCRDPPDAGTETDVGSAAYEHWGDGAGAGAGGADPTAPWLMPTTAPPDLTSPRRSPPVFGCTWTESVVEPSPEESFNASHGTVDEACHRQPCGVLRLTLSVPPDASIACDCAESWTLQGTPSCLSSTLRSLTVTTAVRGWPCVFARTVTATVAAPWPDVGVTLNHDALLAAVHSHSRAASTPSDAVPPPCTNMDMVELRPV